MWRLETLNINAASAFLVENLETPAAHSNYQTQRKNLNNSTPEDNESETATLMVEKEKKNKWQYGK